MTATPSPASVDKQAALVAKLRYMGKQYAAGQVARGGAPQKHYLEEAADELEMMALALSIEKATPQSARENAALRNVIQVACIDGLPGLARAWEKYFPDHPISIKGIEQSTAQPQRPTYCGTGHCSCVECVVEPQAVVPAPNRTPGFDASTPTGRPSRDWYAAKIHETLDDDFTIGSNAAAQPSAQAEPRPNRELLGLAGGSAGLNEDFWAAQAERAPVVQAVQAREYPPGARLWVKKPLTVQAAQWFKNGDHPQDYAADTQGFENGELRVFTGAERKANGWEGSVVRYYRHPDVPGEKPCEQCGKPHHVHGWIDTLEQGHRVCPGDWIITGVKGERYPCKPDIFDATYESADRASTVAALKAERDAALARVAVLEKDAERYRWLRQEHERFDPICHLTWKAGSDRNGSEWVNTAVLDAAIDAALTKGQP